MDTKKIVILVIVIFLIGIGGALGIKNSGKNDQKAAEGGPSLSSLEEAQERRQEVEEEATALATPGGLSIENFAKKTFSGTEFTVGEVLERNSAYTRYYITYRSNGLRISGIMNVPSGSGPFPVLFLNHGYIDPDLYTNGRGLKREQDYLARQGYVVVHSDYRNHAQSDKDPNVEDGLRFAYAEDVINGILALKAAGLSYVDGERIGTLGHSMGGGVAYLVAIAQPDLVAAVVLFAPVSADVRDNFEKWTRSRREVAERIIQKYGAPGENKEFWDNVSPITQFEKVQVPILIQHGTADDSVPLAWSEKALTALKAAGKEAHLDIYPGEPHEFINAWPAVMRRTAAFFDEHVKNK